MPVINTSVIRWLIAFVAAVVLHASLIVWVTTVPKSSTLHAKKQGRGGIEVGIAQLLPAPKVPQPKITPPSKPVAKPVKKPVKKTVKHPTKKTQPIISNTIVKEALATVKPVPSPYNAVAEQVPEPLAQNQQPQSTGGAAVEAQRVSYHAQIMAHLIKYKRYPSRAKRRRMEGVLEVEISLDRQGQLLSYAIVKSSEHKVLDKAAIEMLKRAEPLPPIPAEMEGSVYKGIFSIGYAVR